MEDSDIKIAAGQMIRLHGSRAQTHAGLQASNKLSLGDVEGHYKWNRVRDAIKDMENDARTRTEI